MEIQAHKTTPATGLTRRPETTSDDAKLRQACKDMESVFMGYLLKSMRSTVKTTDLFGSERDESMFRDMLDDEVAKSASKGKGIGIADMLYNQLSHIENQSPVPEKPLKVTGSIVEK
jgi:Rod binding domain-containing protein